MKLEIDITDPVSSCRKFYFDYTKAEQLGIDVEKHYSADDLVLMIDKILGVTEQYDFLPKLKKLVAQYEN